MLFMYIHTHTVEKCLIEKPEESKKRLTKAQEATKKAGIKMLGGYMAPHEHTMFIIFDAPDIVALEKVLVPMTAWGDAQLIPVMTFEQGLALEY
jgi:uncharacterized protein with GYD domain